MKHMLFCKNIKKTYDDLANAQNKLSEFIEILKKHGITEDTIKSDFSIESGEKIKLDHAYLRLRNAIASINIPMFDLVRKEKIK